MQGMHVLYSMYTQHAHIKYYMETIAMWPHVALTCVSRNGRMHVWCAVMRGLHMGSVGAWVPGPCPGAPYTRCWRHC